MLMVINCYYCFHIIEIYVAAIVVIIIYHYYCKVTLFFQILVCGCIIEIYVVATVQGNARHRKIYEKHLHMSHLLLLGKFEYSGGPIFKVVLEC